MLRNENRIEVNRPPAEVFKFIADLCNEPRYVPNVIETEKISDGPAGVGSKYREVTRVMFGRKAVSTYEVTQYDAPTTFAFRGTSGRSTFRGRWVLEATDEGTLARFTAEAQLAWPMKYMERVVRSSVAATFAVMGRNLKLVLTAPPESKKKAAAAKRQNATAAASGSAKKPQGAAKRQSQGQPRPQGSARTPSAGPATAKRSTRARKPDAAKKPDAVENAGDGAAGGAGDGADAPG